MILPTSIITFFSATVFVTFLPGLLAQGCGTTWTCFPTETAPTLDADHSEWEDVEGITSSLQMIRGGAQYAPGDGVFKCLYDSEKIYFALEFPGDYRFNETDDHLCAAIGTMIKIGVDATYVDMGGCPDAISGCDDGVPDTCETYRVDIGAHWELSGTEQSTFYDINVPANDDGTETDTSVQFETTIGTGNDPIANKDDEYAVSPYCRFDDDDADAGNEWAGAWAHTNPVDGMSGTYKFELSRLLKTKSTVTDAQLSPGETYSFGVAFWDPNETGLGWTHSGHYVTGCGTEWIELELKFTGTSGASTFGGGLLAITVAMIGSALWW